MPRAPRAPPSGRPIRRSDAGRRPSPSSSRPPDPAPASRHAPLTAERDRSARERVRDARTPPVRLAIAEYGRVLAGELDRDDPASVAAFKVAVTPIDALRAANRRTRATPLEEEESSPELEEPLPPVEPAPVVDEPPTA